MSNDALCSCRKLLSTRSDVSLTVLRILTGYTFFQAGIGKVFQTGGWILPVSYFEKIGIPVPEVSFLLVGWIELIGGLMLMAGFFVRAAAMPLMLIMFAALMTVHREVGQAYPLMIFAVCGCLVINGAGRLSIDIILQDKLKG